MNYPIGVQSFETLREGGFVYVDKTDLIYQLARGHSYFLCRPRRFGKSLLVSTLKAYFEGKRHLFEGLKMMDMETEWQSYPVFHIDFNGGRYQEGKSLSIQLNGLLSKWEEQYGVECRYGDQPGLRFVDVLAEAHRQTGRRCVVLIDEYDKPMLDALDTSFTTTFNGQRVSVEEANRLTLKGFYSCFKAADQDLRFVLLTGVTKFSQVSVFSGFNQPDDITLDARYEALCGITEEEMYSYFDEPIRRLAAKYKVSVEEMKGGLKKRYDGYHFSDDMTDIYNPFSLLNTFAKTQMRDYWFSTGTPEYLLRLLAHNNETMIDYLDRLYVPADFIDYRADVEKPLPMIFQSGYLTIKDVVYRRMSQSYRLDYPNDEVKNGFVSLLANNFFNTEANDATGSWIDSVVDAFEEGNLERIQKLFTSFLAATPYAMRPKKDGKDRELYFHYTFYLIMRLISCYTVYTEKQLSQGRADCIVETPGYVYIFEFKLDGTADEALQQIRNRSYASAYAADKRPTYCIGASFSSQTGTIDQWKAETAAS